MNSKKLFPALSLLAGLILLLCSYKPFPGGDPAGVKLLMVTDHGSIKIRLYNETPLHRDNFLKLVQEHYFDSLLFHRCIQNFMIQGGDPDSRHAAPGVELGNGGPPYTIPAEINPALFHKRGVLAAARESDLDNPSQASSGSQFYIVQGRVYTDSLLKIQGKRITRMKFFNAVINRPENQGLLEQYRNYAKKNQPDSVKFISDKINKIVDAELPAAAMHEFSPEQIKAYTTIGGTPHLDGSYTVFGEVYEGYEVVESIAAEKVDKMARPLSDIRILKVLIIP
jgi:cyclophilin family peptidyl-prolyl cis-trans isomerase